MILSQNTTNSHQRQQVTIAPPIDLPISNNENAQDSDKKDLVLCFERAVMTRIEKPKVEFNHLTGLVRPKTDLQNSLIIPSLIYQKLQRASSYGTNGVLLYGPPGGGKTSLVKACAHAMNAKFFVVQGKNYYAEIKRPHKFMKELFREARESQPACIVFENLEGIFSHLNRGEDTEDIRRTKTEFLVQMMNAYAEPQMFVIGTTEAPWLLMPAVRRRFPLRVPVFPPDHLERTKLIEEKMLHTEHSLKPEDISLIGDLTEGHSYKTIVDLIRLAKYEPTRELQQAKYFKPIVNKNEGNQIYEACDSADPEAKEMSFLDIPYENIKPRKITIEDFQKVWKKISVSLEKIQMDQYQRFLEEWTEG